jgi:hypothetical protein
MTPPSAVALAERSAATAPSVPAVGLGAKVLALPDAPAGRFLVHELLGRGATATVFRGTDLSDGRPVAIKVAEGPDPRQTERIRAEARILASLDHPAIVTFIAEGVVPAGDQWAGRPFLVEEYVYGGSLAERIRNGTPDSSAWTPEVTRAPYLAPSLGASDGWTRAYCWTASLAVRSTAGAVAARGGRGEGRCPSGRLGVTM